MYDDVRFWIDMDKPHPVPTEPHSIPYQEEAILKLLKTLDFKSVLDVGASVGRMARLIMDNFDVHTYHGVDLSYQRLLCAKSITQKYKGVGVGPDIEFYNCSYYDFRPAQKYDLVIAIEVLMHIPPEKLGGFFSKMVKESNNHIISLDYFPQMTQSAPLAEWNFLHLYPDLYRNNKLPFQSQRVSPFQMLFHGQVKL